MTCDRAAAVARYISDIVKRAQGAELRQHLEQMLRDEFTDIVRQTHDETRLRDE